MKKSNEIDYQLLKTIIDTIIYEIIERFGIRYSEFLEYITALLEWLVLNKKIDTIPNPAKYILLLAKYHLNLYRKQNTRGEVYHLQRSRELYQMYMIRYKQETLPTISDYLDYFKAVLLAGQVNDAIIIIKTILSFFNENHPILNTIPSSTSSSSTADTTSEAGSSSSKQQLNELSSLHATCLFYAGCCYKFNKDFDQASTFFFEALQNGPPMYLSKIDMMMIISRNIEELNHHNNNNSNNDEIDHEDNDDAYRMVNKQIITIILLLLSFL